MNTMTFDLPHAAFLLRAAHAPDAVADLGDRPSTPSADVWLWFLGSRSRDMWFAHGLSDAATEALADTIASSIDAFLAGALITYAGSAWSLIEPLLIPFAQLQREFVDALGADELDQLRRTPTQEILARRLAEERDNLDKNASVMP